jgi:hypothetical protein
MTVNHSSLLKSRAGGKQEPLIAHATNLQEPPPPTVPVPVFETLFGRKKTGLKDSERISKERSPSRS